MKKGLLLFLLAGIFTACKQESTVAEASAAEVPTKMTAPAREGHGKITLQCGPQTLVIDGKCGGVTNTGEMIIAVQDQKVASKVFTISFNTIDYPQQGKIYTVRKSDFMSESKKPDNEIYIGFSEMTQQNQRDWSSDDASGTLQFQVNGNEIKCNFSHLKLQPSMAYNKGEFNNVGTASGEITFYKN